MKIIHHLFIAILFICFLAEKGSTQTIDCEALHKAFKIQDSIVKARSNIICKNGNEANKEEINILYAGEYHHDEIFEGAENKDWYGVFENGSDYVLKKAKITITPFFDPIEDSESDSIMSGKKVSVTDGEWPVILISGLDKTIKEGTIRSDKSLEGILLPMCEKHSRNYPNSITASGSIMPYSNGNSIDWKIEHYSVTLWGYNKCGQEVNQVIATAERFDDREPFSVIWSGDIDQDGRIDLIIDISDHYNNFEVGVFLSSKAEEGQLIELVATFSSQGC